MWILHTISSFVFLGILGYVCWTIWNAYRKQTEGTKYERLWAAMKDSGTIFWNKFIVILAAVVAQLDNLADFFNLPELKNYINSALSNPKTVALVMLLISSVSIVVRMRPKSKDPLE